jgi:hypothetical protein
MTAVAEVAREAMTVAGVSTPTTLVTSCVNAGLTYAQLRFSHAVGYGFARRLLFRTASRKTMTAVAEVAREAMTVAGVSTPTTRRSVSLRIRAVAGNEGRFRVVHETIGGLTELKLYGRAETFASRFEVLERRQHPVAREGEQAEQRQEAGGVEPLREREQHQA